MPEDVRVSPASRQDLAAIAELMQELMDVLHTSEGIDRQQLASSLEKLYASPGCCMLVARKGGRVVGFAQFYTRQTALNPRPCAALDELVVKKGLRRQGIGRLLVDRVIEECRKLDCFEVEVSTELTNSPAQAFYQEYGFEREAVLFEKHL